MLLTLRGDDTPDDGCLVTLNDEGTVEREDTDQQQYAFDETTVARLRLVVETPQYWLLRVVCRLSQTPGEAIGFYRLMSSLAYLPSSPTLFNSGSRHTQMSSCFLVESPGDELDSIYERYHQVARLPPTGLGQLALGQLDRRRPRPSPRPALAHLNLAPPTTRPPENRDTQRRNRSTNRQKP